MPKTLLNITTKFLTKTVVCPIYKKGDKLDCCNFSGITLTNDAYKILSQILFRRLTPVGRQFVGRYQAEPVLLLTKYFQSDRSSRNVAAYGTVDREELWQIVHEYENHFPVKLSRLIKATIDYVMCSVPIGGTLSSSFESRRGLRQGNRLSCLLFNIAVVGVIRRVGIDTSGAIFTRMIQLLASADDIDIIARSLETVWDAYIRLKAEAARIGLQINASKTKYMRVRAAKERNISLPTRVNVEGDELEAIDEFVYLGSLMTADNNISK